MRDNCQKIWERDKNKWNREKNRLDQHKRTNVHLTNNHTTELLMLHQSNIGRDGIRDIERHTIERDREKEIWQEKNECVCACVWVRMIEEWWMFFYSRDASSLPVPTSLPPKIINRNHFLRNNSINETILFTNFTFFFIISSCSLQSKMENHPFDLEGIICTTIEIVVIIFCVLFIWII